MANGLRFAYLEGGSGPLVLCDGGGHASYMGLRAACLAGAGFRVGALRLRGNPPTEIPRSGLLRYRHVAVDVRERSGCGGGDGAGPSARMGRVDRLPGLAALPRSCGAPWRWPCRIRPRPASRCCAEHVHRSFHCFFFSPATAGAGAARGRLVFVEWPWDYWTAPGFTDEEHLAEVKRMLAEPEQAHCAPARPTGVRTTGTKTGDLELISGRRCREVSRRAMTWCDW